jgi:transcriptional regulator with XRE-family HTH domain
MATQESVTIAKRFKELRRELNLTQKQMSEELETTQANISQIENGECLPTGNFMLRVAERFPDVNFNWLFLNQGTPRLSDAAKKVEADIVSKVERNLEKKYTKKFDELNSELKRVQEDNSKLISLVTSGKKKK